MKIKIGQTLWAKNGEPVIVCYVDENEICVRYKEQKIWRGKSIINTKLFLTKDEAIMGRDQKSTWKGNVADESKRYVPIVPQGDSCNNCMLMRREECFGEKKICQYYQHVPYVEKEEIDSWPTECVGPYGHNYKSWKK